MDPLNCYEEAWKLIERYTLHESYPYLIKLVHGYPRLSRDVNGHKKDTLYGHAWVELTYPVEGAPVTICVDSLVEAEILKPVFYHAGKIDAALCSYYSRSEAVAEMMRAMHYGPWKEPPQEAVFAA